MGSRQRRREKDEEEGRRVNEMIVDGDLNEIVRKVR